MLRDVLANHHQTCVLIGQHYTLRCGVYQGCLLTGQQVCVMKGSGALDVINLIISDFTSVNACHQKDDK